VKCIKQRHCKIAIFVVVGVVVVAAEDDDDAATAINFITKSFFSNNHEMYLRKEWVNCTMKCLSENVSANIKISGPFA
jgi:hypothetical protein